MLRLVAGAVALGLERLTDYAVGVEARLAMVPGDPASEETRRATALAVGAILSLPDYARAALATTDRARRSVGRFTGPVTSLLSAVWPGSAVADRVDHLRLMVQEEIERVVTLGRLEAPRAEQMAVQAFDGTVAGLMDHLANSDALRGLVADASAGLTKTAVDEVRGWGCRCRRSSRGAGSAHPATIPPLRPIGRHRVTAGRTPIDERVGTSAGFASRALAISIDTALLTIGIGASTWVIRSFADLLLGPRAPGLDAQVFLWLSPLTVLLYFSIYVSITGRTPGKWLMGLQVVSSNGADVRLGRSVLRFLGYIVSLVPLGAGFLWVLGDDERRGWHDHIARTQVIYQPGKLLGPRPSRRSPGVTSSPPPPSPP